MSRWRETAVDFLGRRITVGAVIVFACQGSGRLRRAVVLRIEQPGRQVGVWVRAFARQPYTCYVKDCARVLLFPGALSHAEARALRAHRLKLGGRRERAGRAAEVAQRLRRADAVQLEGLGA